MKLNRIALAVALAGLSVGAHATNGYFSHGYGMSAKGMGGVGIAYAQDSLAAATNPAGMVYVGNRFDIGVDVFAPDRGFSIAGTEYDGNGSGFMESYFPIPEFGYNRMMNDRMSLGVAVFGNGGMNTTYGNGDHPFATNPGGPGAGSTVGIDLMQMFIAPNIAYKVNDKFSVGATANLIVQAFESQGLSAFFQPDNGKDYSYGASLRVGAMYKVNNAITLGATYQTKADMSKFDDYATLFPNDGEFDIPPNYGIGIAFKATDRLDIAFDVMRIEYESVDVTGNPADMINYFGNTHGFGWEDQTVYKLGVAYKYNDQLTLRAGYNYGASPIDPSVPAGFPDVTFDMNTLAPGVVEHHLTLGFTHNIDATSSVTGAYMHAFNTEIDGAGLPLFGVGGGAGTLEMSQDSFGLSYNKKF